MPSGLRRLPPVAELGQLDLNVLTDSELLALLALPDGQDGLRHYMSKPDKVTFITTEDADVQAAILARARKAQVDHHTFLRGRRTIRAANGGRLPEKHVLIERLLGTDRWRYLRKLSIPRGFRDEATHRKAKVAFELKNIRTGKVVRVTRSTVDTAHERLGNIEAWPPLRGGRAKAPQEDTVAALPTVAQLLGWE